MRSSAGRRDPAHRRTGPARRREPVRPVPPVLAAALALAGGIALGLYRPALLPLAAIFPLLPLFASGLHSRLQSPLPASTAGAVPPSVLLALVVASGSLLGARSGGALRRACESSLDSGITVRVRGIVSEDVAPPAGPTGTAFSRLRISLENAVLSADSGDCALPRLTAFVERPWKALAAGESVALEGEWLRLRARSAGRSSLDLPGRAGILVGARPWDAGAGPGSASPARLSGRLSELRRAARSAASRRLRARLPDGVDPIARALLLAERDELPSGLRRRFADAGLAHLLAISGLHVGIIAGLVLALLTPLAGGRSRYLLAAGAVGLYVAILGAPVPAVRAALLFAGWAIARFRGTPVRGADLLGATALVFLVGDPTSLVSPGFQLSFAGYAGVSLGLSACRQALSHGGKDGRRRGSAARRAGRGVTVVLSAGAGAFLATCPISAWHFGRVAPVSVVSNLVGTPIVALSIWSLVGAMLPEPVGGAFAASATAFLTLLESLAKLFGSGAASHFDVSPPPLDAWIAWGLGFEALARTARGAAPARLLTPLAAAASLLVVQPAERIRALADHGMLCTLSVGQGDAAVLRTAAGRWLVFDGGPPGRPGPGREEISSALRRRGAGSVALITLSHPDLDHIGGLEGLLYDLPVGAVLDTGDPLPREAYARLLTLAEATGVEWLRARSGVRIRVDEVEILVLGPDSGRAPDPAGPGPGANETSLVFRVTAGGFRYINSGDARVEEERRVLSAWPADSLRADLLKIGHHGSRTSTSTEWLAAVRPAVAVISAGPGNRFGHPHPEVLDRIRGSNVPVVWRTDRSGTLCVEYLTDGRWRIAGESAWNGPATSSRAGRHED